MILHSIVWMPILKNTSYRELLREWLKGNDCITEKLHEDKIVINAREGGNMEDSFDISEQNSCVRGVCNVLLNLRF